MKTRRLHKTEKVGEFSLGKTRRLARILFAINPPVTDTKIIKIILHNLSGLDQEESYKYLEEVYEALNDLITKREAAIKSFESINSAIKKELNEGMFNEVNGIVDEIKSELETVKAPPGMAEFKEAVIKDLDEDPILKNFKSKVGSIFNEEKSKEIEERLKSLDTNMYDTMNKFFELRKIFENLRNSSRNLLAELHHSERT